LAFDVVRLLNVNPASTAERDETAIEEAATAFNRLGTIDRRRVLASYGPLL
jgi:hypothetical protein